jgi:predicted anti-sigma-YlaC factor YlaD
MKLNLNCQEVSRMISDGQDLQLPASDRARFRLHLVMCANCRNVDEQMKFLRLALRGLHAERPEGSETRPSDLD